MTPLIVNLGLRWGLVISSRYGRFVPEKQLQFPHGIWRLVDLLSGLGAFPRRECNNIFWTIKPIHYLLFIQDPFEYYFPTYFLIPQAVCAFQAGERNIYMHFPLCNARWVKRVSPVQHNYDHRNYVQGNVRITICSSTKFLLFFCHLKSDIFFSLFFFRSIHFPAWC